MRKEKTLDDEAALLPLDEWVAYRFGLIAARIGSIGQSAYQKKHGLSPGEWRILAVIARYEPCSAAEVSRRSRLEPPKISRAVETLVTAGLILRDKDPQDQRRAVLTLTSGGRSLYTEIAIRAVRFEEYVTSTLTAREKEVLWRAVTKIDQQIAVYERPESTE